MVRCRVLSLERGAWISLRFRCWLLTSSSRWCSRGQQTRPENVRNVRSGWAAVFLQVLRVQFMCSFLPFYKFQFYRSIHHWATPFLFSFLPCGVILLDFKFPTLVQRTQQGLSFFLQYNLYLSFFLNLIFLTRIKYLCPVCLRVDVHKLIYGRTLDQCSSFWPRVRCTDQFLAIFLFHCLISNFITTLFGKYNMILQLYSKFCSKLILGRFDSVWDPQKGSGVGVLWLCAVIFFHDLLRRCKPPPLHPYPTPDEIASLIHCDIGCPGK